MSHLINYYSLSTNITIYIESSLAREYYYIIISCVFLYVDRINLFFVIKILCQYLAEASLLNHSFTDY